MLIDWNILAVLAPLVIMSASTPGPDVIYLSSNALSGKWKNGLVAWGGLATGITIYALVTALGLTVAFHAFPIIYTVIKWMGVAYLAYMAFLFLKNAMRGDHTFQITQSCEYSLLQIYNKGVLGTLLNPKTTLFFTAFLPQFLDMDKGQIPLQLLELGMASILIGQCVYGVYLVMFTFLGKKVRSGQLTYTPFLSRALNGICGSLYAIFAVGLMFWKKA